LERLSIYEGKHETEHSLEQLVAEHPQKEIIVVEAHVLLEKCKVNHVDNEVLAKVHEDEDHGCQVYVLGEDRAQSHEDEHRQAIEPRVEAVFEPAAHQKQAHCKLYECPSHNFDPIFNASLCVVFIDQIGINC